MSVIATLIIVSPILTGCLVAAGVDIAARIHGGWSTPTPVVDLAVAAGHGTRVILLAIPAYLVIGTIRAVRGGRA